MAWAQAGTYRAGCVHGDAEAAEALGDGVAGVSSGISQVQLEVACSKWGKAAATAVTDRQALSWLGRRAGGRAKICSAAPSQGMLRQSDVPTAASPSARLTADEQAATVSTALTSPHRTRHCPLPHCPLPSCRTCSAGGGTRHQGQQADRKGHAAVRHRHVG